MDQTGEALTCCIPTCRFNSTAEPSDSDLHHLAFFSFPLDPLVRSLWIEKCSIVPNEESKVCSTHFTEEDFECSQGSFLNVAPNKVLKKTSFPSINLPSNLICGTVLIVNQQQLPLSTATMSVISESWSLNKSGALKLEDQMISNAKPSQLWELCRMCAGTADTMIPIFNEDGSDKDNTALKLNKYLSLNVSPLDGLPVRLCVQCSLDLNFCHHLAQKCSHTDAALRCLLETDTSTSISKETETTWPINKKYLPASSADNQVNWTNLPQENVRWNAATVVSSMASEPKPVPVDKTVKSSSRSKMIKLAVKKLPQDALISTVKFSTKEVKLPNTEVTEGAPKRTAGDTLENVPLRDRLRNKTRRRGSTYNCKECGKQFDNKPELQQHLNDSHDKYDCKVCEDLFDSREEAERHESTPHNIPCPECKDVFPTHLSLQTHIEMVHTSKKPFACFECGRHFVSKVTLRVHLRTHTGKRTTVCDICKKAFRTFDALRQHKFVHMTDEEKKNMGFPCTVCDKKFSRRTKLEYHMRRHTDERHFTCTICNKSFHDSVRLKAHIERHSTDKKFKCDDCGSGFVCKRYLTNHKSRYHRRREVIRCSVCLVTFPTADEATKHHKTHTEEEISKCGATDPYTQSFDHQCRQCCEYFPGKEQLDAHKAVAHVRGRSSKASTTLDIADLIKQVDCTICGKKLWGLGSLKRHMSSHTGNRPERIFQCEFCAKMFAQKAQLVVHIRTHTGERPHRCSYCGKGFITGQSLIKHERIHTGETPFHCTQCPKAFRSKENLILHQKTHLGLKPFECTYCRKSFGRQIHLQLHLRTHTGERPYVCDICGRAFAQGGDMRRHKLTHTGERAYKCTVCCFSSNKRKTLRDHEASTHASTELIVPDAIVQDDEVITLTQDPSILSAPQAMVSVSQQQYATNIIQDPRTVMFLTTSELHKNWGEN